MDCIFDPDIFDPDVFDVCEDAPVVSTGGRRAIAYVPARIPDDEEAVIVAVLSSEPW